MAYILIEINCGGPPTSDPNGKIIKNNGTLLLDEVEYTCNEGYFIRGSSTLYCREDGRWSDRAPVCRRKYIEYITCIHYTHT